MWWYSLQWWSHWYDCNSLQWWLHWHDYTHCNDDCAVIIVLIAMMIALSWLYSLQWWLHCHDCTHCNDDCTVMIVLIAIMIALSWLYSLQWWLHWYDCTPHCNDDCTDMIVLIAMMIALTWLYSLHNRHLSNDQAKLLWQSSTKPIARPAFRTTAYKIPFFFSTPSCWPFPPTGSFCCPILLSTGAPSAPTSQSWLHLHLRTLLAQCCDGRHEVHVLVAVCLQLQIQHPRPRVLPIEQATAFRTRGCDATWVYSWVFVFSTCLPALLLAFMQACPCMYT
jgi:hypothetical protein